MAVRPFWIEAWIDGAKNPPLSGGPRRKDGAMTVNVLQRVGGGKTTAVQISCHPWWDDAGKQYLITDIKDARGDIIKRVWTEY